jgi:predicted GNAT family N-acyltransferase
MGVKMFEVRIATTAEELSKIFAFRYRIFVHELSKPIRHADHAKGILADQYDPVATQLYLTKDEKIVGAIRILNGRAHACPQMEHNFALSRFSPFRDEHFSFTSRLFILPEYRCTRALITLLKAIYDLARSKASLLDFIVCGPKMVKLYEQLGYRRYKEHGEDPEMGLIIPMVLVLDDVPHMRRVKSPFYRMAKNWPSEPGNASWVVSEFMAHESKVSTASLLERPFGAHIHRKPQHATGPFAGKLGSTS